MFWCTRRITLRPFSLGESHREVMKNIKKFDKKMLRDASGLAISNLNNNAEMLSVNKHFESNKWELKSEFPHHIL